MPYSNEMQTVAEIAIAMAGFAGIITALRASAYARGSVDYARLRELLLTSLGGVFFAFIPALISGLSEEPLWVWQMPLLAFGLYHVSLMVTFFRATGLGGPKAYEWVLIPLALTIVAIQFSVGLGLFPEFQPEAYFLSLLWILFIAANNFAVLLLEGATDDK